MDNMGIQKISVMLKDKKHYSIEKLYDTLLLENIVSNKNEFASILLDIIEYHISSLDLFDPVRESKFLDLIFEYLRKILKNNDNINCQQRILDLQLRVEDIICKISKKTNTNKLYRDNLQCLSFLKYKLLFLNSEVNPVRDTPEKEENTSWIRIFQIVLFEVKNYQLLETLLREKPFLLKTKINNNDIFDELITPYVNAVANNNKKDIIYFSNVCNYLINSDDYFLSVQHTRDLQKKLSEQKRLVAVKNYLIYINFLIDDLKQYEEKFDKKIKKLNIIYGIKTTYSKKIIEESKRMSLCNKGFIDYTNKEIITIDNDNAECFDDGFSLEKLSNGNWLLGVHISDVASYIPKNSLINKEAFKQGFKEYLPDSIIPMFPSTVNEKLFSLNEHKNKYVLSHMYELSESYDLIRFYIKKAHVVISKNYTFSEVNNIINNELDSNKKIKDILNLVCFLKKQNICKQLYHKTKELKRKVEGNELIKHDNSMAAQIVEELIILTNYFIASQFNDQKNQFPFLYRNNSSKCNMDIINRIKENINTNNQVEESIAIINEIYKPSIYSNNNYGHNGLNLDAYCHGTTPIRNFAALTVERLIHEFLLQEKTDDKNIYRWEKNLGNIAKHLNEKKEANNSYNGNYQKIYNSTKNN